MKKYKVFILIFLGLCIVSMLSTGIHAYLREQKVLKVEIGMAQTEVENLLGGGDIGYSGCNSELCQENAKQYWYKANPSLWYGRFEDSLSICYFENIVCDFERVGL